MTEEGSARNEVVALVGDASLFTAVLIPTGPLALLGGPALAWLLHGRPLGARSGIAAAAGLAAALALVAAVVAAAMGIGRSLGDAAAWFPIALLSAGGVLATVALVALDAAAIRDLAPGRRLHVRRHVARLAATAVLATGLAAAVIVQTVQPASGAGEAPIFALVAACIGALTAAISAWVEGRLLR